MFEADQEDYSGPPCEMEDHGESSLGYCSWTEGQASHGLNRKSTIILESWS